MPNAQNIEMLATIKGQLENANAMWVVDYRGLTVKEIQNLRANIREAGASMAVYKNTIMQIALKELDGPNLDEILEGPSAFIIPAEDPVASAKAIKQFAAGNQNLQIKGGMMDGKFVTADQVKEIASLPSREELIAKLLGTINNPMVKTVRVLNGPMEAFARCVSAIAKKAA